jgi:hypothetical protein
MVSTSNEIDGDEAVVIADKPILWTIEFRKEFHEGIKNGRSSTTGKPKYHLKPIK